MRKGASILAGFLAVLALGVVVPLASSDTPPSQFVQLSQGECERTRYASYASNLDEVAAKYPGFSIGGEASPEEALAASNFAEGKSADSMHRRDVSSREVAFEEVEDGKTVATYLVIKIGEEWVVQEAHQKESCK